MNSIVRRPRSSNNRQRPSGFAFGRRHRAPGPCRSLQTTTTCAQMARSRVRQRFFWIFWLQFALAGEGLQSRIESRPGLVSCQIMLPFVARPTFPRTFARPSASVLVSAARFGGASHCFDRSNALLRLANRKTRASSAAGNTPFKRSTMATQKTPREHPPSKERVHKGKTRS